MVDIPPEIISDILLLLPARSLGRFKAVSKSWLAQITEPRFIKNHLNTVKLTRLIYNSNNEGLIYTVPFDHQTPKLSIFFPNTESTLYFSHGSCNGLVLGTACFGSFDKSRAFDNLVILNPTTKKFVKLSETDYETFERYIDHRCGFGYDSLTNDYKVVTLAYYYTPNRFPSVPIYVHIYSLRNNTWRRLMDFPYSYDHFHNYNNEEVAGVLVNGVLVNGCLHWIVTKLLNNVLVRVIVGFSLADETFTEFPSPDWGNGVDMKVCKLVAFDEKLGLLAGDGVWLMNEYGVSESWSKITIHEIVGNTYVTYVESLVSLKSCSRLTIHKLTNSSGSEPATLQDATIRGGGRDNGTSGGRGRSGGKGRFGGIGRDGGRGSRGRGGRGRSGGRGRFGGSGRDGGRGSRGRGGRGRY